MFKLLISILVILLILFLIYYFFLRGRRTKNYLNDLYTSYALESNQPVTNCYPVSSPKDALFGQIDLISGKCLLQNSINRRFSFWNNGSKTMKVIFFGVTTRET